MSKISNAVKSLTSEKANEDAPDGVRVPPPDGPAVPMPGREPMVGHEPGRTDEP